jgi:hypothetical protein
MVGLALLLRRLVMINPFLSTAWSGRGFMVHFCQSKGRRFLDMPSAGHGASTNMILTGQSPSGFEYPNLIQESADSMRKLNCSNDLSEPVGPDN